jgi:uroporphyrinogen-III synthase
MRLWITRTRPAARDTADRLAALGHDPVIAPLLAVRVLAPASPVPAHAALAFTSRNAVAAWAGISPDRALPVFCVGDATAGAARAVGFTDVRSASGDARALAALIRDAAPGPVLVPGPTRPAADLAALVGADVPVLLRAVYETVETDIPAPGPFDGVLFHSARAANAFARHHAASAPGRIALALSEAVAEPLRALGFAEVRIAARPDEGALLDTLGPETLGKPPGPV